MYPIQFDSRIQINMYIPSIFFFFSCLFFILCDRHYVIFNSINFRTDNEKVKKKTHKIVPNARPDGKTNLRHYTRRKKRRKYENSILLCLPSTIASVYESTVFGPFKLDQMSLNVLCRCCRHSVRFTIVTFNVAVDI